MLAGEGATFGYPEIDLGLVPAIHFAHLPRIVGRHRAFELLFEQPLVRRRRSGRARPGQPRGADQYGTIVDMQKGLTEAVTPFLKKKGWDGEPEQLRHLVAAHALRELDDRRASAIAGIRPTGRSGIARFPTSWTAAGIAYTQDEVRWLVGEIEKLKPFPDVVAALERLRSADTSSRSSRTATATC